MNGRLFYSHGTTNSRGVFIALRKNLEFKILSPEICDPQGHRILNTDTEYRNDRSLVILTNYYAPNNQSDQLKTLKEI